MTHKLDKDIFRSGELERQLEHLLRVTEGKSFCAPWFRFLLRKLSGARLKAIEKRQADNSGANK